LGNSSLEDRENVKTLRAARDAALLVAQAAVRDSTRLTRLLTILSEPAPLEQLLDRALSTLSELFSADIVVLLDPARNGIFVPLAAIGIPEEHINEAFSNAAGSYTAEAMRSQTPILVENMDMDGNVDFLLRDLGARTGIWLPLAGNDAVRGVLIVARCNPLPFTHAEAGLLSAMTYHISLSLEQAQRSMQLRQIADLGREIGRNLDEDDVCSHAALLFPQVIGADAAVFYLRDRDGRLSCVAESNFNRDWVLTCTALTKHLIAGLDAESPLPYNITDLPQMLAQYGIDHSQDCPVATLMAAPIQWEGQVRGMLMGMRFSAVPFTPDTQRIAMLYAGQAAAAIENARLYQAVRAELAERKQAELALRASDDRFRALIRGVTDVITILTEKGQFSYVSPAAKGTWGCVPETLLNRSIFDRVHPDDRQMIQTLLAISLAHPYKTISEHVRIAYGSGFWRDFEASLTNLRDELAVGGIVGTFHDVTERRTYEQELRNLAFRDPLTGLSNRAHFSDCLTSALTRANERNTSVAVIFFDLDNFKLVNDSMGHAWGDRVLRDISDRLLSILRKDDIIARLGGDEFTILVDNVRDIEEVMPVVHRVLTVLKEPIHLNDRELLVGGSLGIAMSTPNQDTADDLLRKADLAMYEAKSRQKGTYAIFEAQ
jgi:diguanylate cyclase (GGDEF)-like protein/PAS domain S-box-containing protein